MRSEEPSDITRARDLLKKSEKSQEYTERVRYFEAAVDLLTTQDGSPFEHLAATIKKTHIDKLIKDTPPRYSTSSRGRSTNNLPSGSGKSLTRKMCTRPICCFGH
jgi:hypothetical protein